MSFRMHNVWLAVVVGTGVCSLAMLAAAGQAAPAATGAPQGRTASSASSDGEQIFATNCARCHTPPMTLGPRVTGAVIEHMRVRARLSRKEEQQLLKYLAP